MNEAKPFCISKQKVWEAYERVKANRGTAGIDNESLAQFESNLKNNLYRIWNRMSSGSYFPPPVKRVDIPKKDGRTRPLGIPTVSDRIAQTVVKLYLEPEVEPYFHPDSYGYRPGKSALEAVGVCRQRCWRHNWVVDLDIKGFFDNLDHELVMRAVRRFTDSRWILLYIERWLKAPVQLQDGTLLKRDKGTPQGGVISPLIANIFLHLAFDDWMRTTYPRIPFARYADDVVVHCKTLRQANYIRRAIEQRLARCKLELHPDKTRIVYCKDDNRREEYPDVKFTFLGYEFRPRSVMSDKGGLFVGFTPAISGAALNSMRRKMRDWQLHLRSGSSIEDLSELTNAALNGWINYYCGFNPSAIRPAFDAFNRILVNWAMRKYKKLRRHKGRAWRWLGRIARKEPELFAHWKRLGVIPATA